MTYEAVLKEVMKLSIDDRTLLAHEIWRSVEDEAAAAELSDAQRAELERRAEDARRNPGDGIPWDVVKARLRARWQQPRRGDSV
jgi:putative addiction module component (TIGR02574 family)